MATKTAAETPIWQPCEGPGNWPITVEVAATCSLPCYAKRMKDGKWFQYVMPPLPEAPE